MSALAPISSVPANALAVFCLALVLPILGFRTAHAQCSQAARSEATSSTQSSDSAQNTPPHAISGESSSTSGAVHAVRFATGSAITVPEETPLQVMTNMPISSRTAKAGARFSLTVTRDVIVDDILVIPCGATVFGTVVEAKQAGRLVGASNLTLQLTALDLGGRRYALYTPHFKVVSASKTGSTVKKVSIGAAAGTLVADATVPGPRAVTVLDGSPVPHQEFERVTATQRAAGDALVGSVGAGIGVAVAASSPPSIALIPAESEMEFTLASPIAVYPVDQSTAARLAQGMRRGGPVLYVRGESD